MSCALAQYGSSAWSQAQMRNVDMTYNHVYYVDWHNQEIQESERAVYDQNDTK